MAHKKQTHYDLRHASHFDVPIVNSVCNGTESISFLVPKIWAIQPNEIKEVKTVEIFKDAIKNENRKIALVYFASSI